MLIEQTHYPLGNDGNIPWGKIIIGLIIVGAVVYSGYKLMPKTEPDLEIKNIES